MLPVICLSAFAQKVITGTVRDANGEPMIGVTVLVDGYNPQNEMFRRFRTKCSISQNETYPRESFFPPL